MKRKLIWGTILLIFCSLPLAFILPPVFGNTKINREQPIVLRLQSFIRSLHPLKMVDVDSRQVATLLYTGLIAQDQNGEMKPAVASHWSHTGNEWVFTLKKGMTFSNGQPVTSSDVVSSICNAMQPYSPWAWTLLSIEYKDSKDKKSRECSGIETLNKNQVRIIEKKPVPWLIEALSSPAGWILPEGVKEKDYGVMPGTGPYTIQDIVPDEKIVLKARKKGVAISPGSEIIQFQYLPDDSIAAKEYITGNLHVLDLKSPQLVELLTEKNSLALKYPGKVNVTSWDRVRLLIVNEKALAAKGFRKDIITDFIHLLSAKIDRQKLALISKGIGEPLWTPFPPARKIKQPRLTDAGKIDNFPKVSLIIKTIADPYSDLIAASIPKRIGKVMIDYTGVNLGILMNSLFKSDYDIISIPLEAALHSAEYWKAFFTPGNPFSAFGKPISGMEHIDITTDNGIAEAGKKIAESGNWIMLLQEKHIQAIAPGIEGILFSPSGLVNFAFIKKQ